MNDAKPDEAIMGDDGKTPEWSEYERSAPVVQERLERYERAVAGVRSTHTGHPAEEVRKALAAAFEAESLNVWSEVLEDATQRIAGRVS